MDPAVVEEEGEERSRLQYGKHEVVVKQAGHWRTREKATRKGRCRCDQRSCEYICEFKIKLQLGAKNASHYELNYMESTNRTVCYAQPAVSVFDDARCVI